MDPYGDFVDTSNLMYDDSGGDPKAVTPTVNGGKQMPGLPRDRE